MSEYRSPDGAEEVVERKCQLNVEAPYLLKKVFKGLITVYVFIYLFQIAGVDFIYFLQKNSLDKRKRTLLIEATNISFSSRVIVKENCLYYVRKKLEFIFNLLVSFRYTQIMKNGHALSKAQVLTLNHFSDLKLLSKSWL